MLFKTWVPHGLRATRRLLQRPGTGLLVLQGEPNGTTGTIADVSFTIDPFHSRYLGNTP